MMRAKFKIAEPDNCDLTLTITLKTHEWRDIMRSLKPDAKSDRGESPSGIWHPGNEFAAIVATMIGEATAHMDAEYSGDMYAAKAVEGEP